MLVICQKLPSNISDNLYGVIVSIYVMGHWLENVASLNNIEEPKEFSAQMTPKNDPSNELIMYQPLPAHNNRSKKDYTAGISKGQLNLSNF